MSEVMGEAPEHRGQEVSVFIRGGTAQSEGVCFVEILSPRRRLYKAIKVFLIWFLLGIASVAIPILHFLTVPIFLLLAVVLSSWSYSVRSIVTGGRGTCPYCHAPFTIVKSRETWPLADQCSECYRQVTIAKRT